MEQSQYSASLFVVYKNGDVYDTAGNKKASGAQFVKPTGSISALNSGIEGRGWPMQSWMQPDPGEGHIALYNPETGAYDEFIYAKIRLLLDFLHVGRLPARRAQVAGHGALLEPVVGRHRLRHEPGQLHHHRARDAHRGRALQGGDYANLPVESQAERRDIEIFARRGAPVIAVNDGRIVGMGRSKRLGRWIRLGNVYGNTFTYADLGELSKSYPVLRERRVSWKAIARELDLPRPGARPRQPA